MALVKCPECGREKVSDTATTCPDCGFNVREHFQKLKEVIFCNIRDTNLQYKYLNGFEEGVRGIYTSDKDRSYYVKDGYIYLPSEEPYFISEKFLLPVKDSILYFEGTIPEDTTFDSIICAEHFTQGKNRWSFNKNGVVETEEGEKGIYMRKGDFLVYKMSNSVSSLNRPQIFAIYENKLYMFGYVRQEYVGEILLLKNEIAEKNYPFTPPELAIRDIYSYSNSTAIKCPYCNSVSTKRIGTVGRSVSFGLFGFGSSKVGKQWHCNNCGSNF